MKEKLAGLVVKMKENKKMSIIIGIVVAVVLVLLIVALVFGLSGASYKGKVKKFVAALNNEEKMEKFVEKNVDFRALYAVSQCDDVDDFKDEYKNAKKDDYQDDDFVDGIKKGFNYYVDEDVSKYKIKNIGKLKDPDSDDDVPKGFKTVKATIVDDEDQEYTLRMYFYKGKVLYAYVSEKD